MVLLHELVAMCRNQFVFCWRTSGIALPKKKMLLPEFQENICSHCVYVSVSRKYVMISYKVSWISSRCAKLRRRDHQILRARSQTPGTFQARCRNRKPTRTIQVQFKWPNTLLVATFTEIWCEKIQLPPVRGSMAQKHQRKRTSHPPGQIA